MKIGEALKEERLKLGLSIRKMADGILDPTFYSRVEQEHRNIGPEALVRILFAREINIDEFFNKIKDTYAPSEATKKAYLEEKIRIAFNSHDITAMRDYLKDVSKLNDPILRPRVIVGIAYLEDKIKELPHEVVDQIYAELDKNDELSSNVNAIRLFTNAMPIFSDEQLTYFMHMLLTRVKEVENKSEKYDERIAITCNNYLYSCWQRKINPSTVEEAYSFMMGLTEPHLLIYKLLGKMGKNLIDGNSEQAIAIKNELLELGYAEMIKLEFVVY